MLKIKNLSKKFGNQDVLVDFNYHFKPKTVYALMGANGSGKTTLFNAIGGFLAVEEGDMLFKNKNIANIPPLVLLKVWVFS